MVTTTPMDTSAVRLISNPWPWPKTTFTPSPFSLLIYCTNTQYIE